MKHPILITTDLHFTANPRDAYRWGLFPFLKETCKQHQVSRLLILGDITDAKDYHPSTLVNRLVSELVNLSLYVDELIILCGNHDYLKSGEPYFQFLDRFERIRFISAPTELEGALFLPHTKTPKTDWAEFDFKEYDFVFLHQTVTGAIASNGQVMDGELDSKFISKPSTLSIYSGDIHVPQVIGDVEYIGSPYPVHFGDTFSPRLLFIDSNGSCRDLVFDSIKRFTVNITHPDELLKLKLKTGDQVKVRVVMSSENKHNWDSIRKDVMAIGDEVGFEIHGIELKVESTTTKRIETRRAKRESSLVASVCRFVEHEDAGGEILDAALDIIEESRMT